jgi:hypothetical protein
MGQVCAESQDISHDFIRILSVGGKTVAALTAFLDESGTNPEIPVLAVGGFYGNADQWTAFRNKWRPHSSNFHAKKSSRLFPQMFESIIKSGVLGIVVTVSKKIYKEKATDHLKTAVGNPYSVCALLCASTMCEESKKRISFVLENGQPNLEFVKGILEAMSLQGHCVAAVASANKRDFVELHAADFLSHIVATRDLDWMQQLFDHKRLGHVHITKKILEETNPKITNLFRQAARTREKLKRVTQL